ncbi:MAG: VOC family protein [Opitutales bacterium]|nr:VOC family protein [Opitutales bacterium]
MTFKLILKSANFIFCFFGFTLAAQTNFPKQTIDLGLVVSDLNQSLDFYKEVVGFREIEGFEVKGSFPQAVGLTDGAQLTIKVLVLGDNETATKLKVMKVNSKKEAKEISQPFIHTITGFSYITVFVNDVDKILDNAQKKGLKPYAKSPQILPQGFPQDLCLLMLKDPDGNFVEIVGPNTKLLRVQE